MQRLNHIAYVSIVLSFSYTFFADAHTLPFGVIYTELEAEERTIKFTTVAPQFISYSTDGGQSEFESFENYFSNKFLVHMKGESCPFTLQAFDNTTTLDESVFSGVFHCTSPLERIEDIQIETSIFKEDFTRFDHFVTTSLQDKLWEISFTQEREQYPDEVSARYIGTYVDRFYAVAKQFFLLGVKHIWNGYDHILFLLSIILLLRSLKRILMLVTAFTIAHSLTLILAGLNVVHISGAIVEPVIALTIIYVSYRNILALRRDETVQELSEGWWLTFGFGLIHGLGFAGALMETHLPTIFYIPALIIFNAGIEVGQLAILVVAVPILFAIDKYPRRAMILRVITTLVGLLAIFWFIERVF